MQSQPSQDPCSFGCNVNTLNGNMAEIKNPDGSLQLQNPEAKIVSKLALDLVIGYYADVSAISLAMDIRSDKLIPKGLPN